MVKKSAHCSWSINWRKLVQPQRLDHINTNVTKTNSNASKFIQYLIYHTTRKPFIYYFAAPSKKLAHISPTNLKKFAYNKQYYFLQCGYCCCCHQDIQIRALLYALFDYRNRRHSFTWIFKNQKQKQKGNT
jgi:hypothetical protein